MINKIFNKLMSTIKRNKNRVLNFNIARNLTNSAFINSGYREKLLEIHSLIYAVVDRKSKAIAQLPLRLYKNDVLKENKCVFKRKSVVNNDISYILNTSPNNNMTPYIYFGELL